MYNNSTKISPLHKFFGEIVLIDPRVKLDPTSKSDFFEAQISEGISTGKFSRRDGTRDFILSSPKYCISTSASSLRFISVTLNSFYSDSPKLSLPLQSFPSRKTKKLVKVNSSPKAVYSENLSMPEIPSPQGVWSIRDDLHLPSSPYFPAYAQGQGPPPMVQERFQSIISQLFQYRIIRCGGAVDDDMANIIVAQLLYLDVVDPTKDIVMYVNSPGGSVTAGMAIFDTMRQIRPDVSTISSF